MSRTITFAAAALIAFAGAGVWYMTSQSGNAQTATVPAAPTPATTETTETTAPAVDQKIVEMTLGDANAPVTVVEYASFTCGHCANFHKDQLQKLKSDYVETGKVHYIYRDVYFDRIGLWASMLARCEPPRFFGVVDLLYTRQHDWLDSQDPVVIAENLRKLGKVAGMSEERINACMEDGDTAQALVAWFEENRARDDINATPTLIIDGEQHSNMSYADLKAILDTKLGQ